MTAESRIAELERALAETTLALERAEEQLQLLPQLYEASEDAARRLRHAEAAYRALSDAHEEMLATYADLEARHAELRERLAALTNGGHQATPATGGEWRQLAAQPPTAEREPASLNIDVPPEPIRARWEYPPPGALVGDYLYISGWAVGTVEIVEAELRVADRRFPLRLGRPRWDVAALFPDRADAAAPGFETVIRADALPPGESNFELVIRDEDGRRFRELRRLRIDTRGAYLEWQRVTYRTPPPTDGPTLPVWVCGASESTPRTMESLTRQTTQPAVTLGDADVPQTLERLEQSGFEWVVLVRAGANLDRDALASLAEAIDKRPDLDVVYADHDIVTEGGDRVRPFLKPGWSPDLLVAMDYAGPLVAIRRSLLARAAAGLERMPAPDEILLRLLDVAPLAVERVPRVLAAVPAALEQSAIAHEVLEDLGRRRGATVEVRERSGLRDVTWRFAAEPAVSLIIPSANSDGLLGACIRSVTTHTSYPNFEVVVVDTSDDGIAGLDEMLDPIPHRVLRWQGPFNYSAANNLGAEHATGEYLVLLNDDTEVVTPDWLERMLEYAQQPGVGVVGAKLVRPDGTLQHGGARLVVRFTAAKNLFEALAADDPGPRGLLTVPRNCSAVTFACAMVPRVVYDELGGLDAAMKVTFNDVDFCLRARSAGKRIVWTPRATLLHHEHASTGPNSYPGDMTVFRRRWGDAASQVDPYYHPELSDLVDYELRLGERD